MSFSVFPLNVASARGGSVRAALRSGTRAMRKSRSRHENTREASGTSLWRIPYPFTAPAVRPETIRRWNRSTIITSGIVTMTAAAAICPQGIVN